MENSLEKILGGELLTKQLKDWKKTLQKLSKENNTNIKFGELLKYYLK
jgi:hypothetical protein